MACQNCFVNETEKFQKTTCVFKSRQPLVLFLLNVVLNIEKFWADFCYRTDSKLICFICQMRVFYLNDQYDIYENSLNTDFLSKFHQDLITNLTCSKWNATLYVKSLIQSTFTLFYTVKYFFDGHILIYLIV